MHFKEFLTEVHWQDLYPKSFQDFRKKWMKHKKEGYYVQFSNYKDNTLDKNAWTQTDHTDPVGVYGYPLEYVVDFPADIWYGQRAKYLRVLKNTSKNKVNLRYMDSYDAKRYLYKLGLETDLEYVIKLFKLKGVSKYGQAFMNVIQFDLDKEPILDGYNKPEYHMRTSQEQTQLLLKAGIDALQDSSSRDTQASINQREPEQVIFLKRNAFEVVDVYTLREESTKSLVKNSPDEDHSRKLAALIFQGLNDQLSEGPERENFGHNYWSKGGRRIEISFEHYPGYIKNKKIGQKLHKQHKFADEYNMHVILFSEKGEQKFSFNREEKFSEIVKNIRTRWENSENKNQSSYTKQIYLQQKDADHKESLRKSIEEKERKDKENENFYLPLMIKVSRKYNLGFKPDPNRKYHYTKILQSLLNGYDKNHSNDSSKDFEAIKKEFPDSNDGLFYEMGYLPKNPPKDIVALKKIFELIKNDGMWALHKLAISTKVN